jgi:hypothetical protein
LLWHRERERVRERERGREREREVKQRQEEHFAKATRQSPRDDRPAFCSAARMPRFDGNE